MQVDQAKVHAPEVGAIIEYGVDFLTQQPRTYRVQSYLREVAVRPAFEEKDFIDEILFDSARKVKGVKLRWCLREDATHVSIYGICGAVVPISACKVVGMVDWPQKAIDELRERAIKLGEEGELLM